MSWRDAPLYVEAFDLAAWLLPRTERWPATLGDASAAAARDVVLAVARALAFPDRRRTHLQVADEALQDLRVLLRLARTLDHLTAAQHRFVAARIEASGRMLGGWRRRVARRAGETLTGGGPPAASIV